MSLLNKKVYNKLEPGKYSVVFTEVKEIPKNEVTKVDEYVQFIGTIPSEDNRVFNDTRFEKGLSLMMYQLIQKYFPQEKGKDYTEVIQVIMNKPIDVWVSYTTNELTGQEYTNISYLPPVIKKVSTETPINIQGL